MTKRGKGHREEEHQRQGGWKRGGNRFQKRREMPMVPLSEASGNIKGSKAISTFGKIVEGKWMMLISLILLIFSQLYHLDLHNNDCGVMCPPSNEVATLLFQSFSTAFSPVDLAPNTSSAAATSGIRQHCDTFEPRPFSPPPSLSVQPGAVNAGIKEVWRGRQAIQEPRLDLPLPFSSLHNGYHGHRPRICPRTAIE